MSSFRYRYDALHRLTNRWSAAKGNTRYVYDLAGNLTLIDYPSSMDIIKLNSTRQPLHEACQQKWLWRWNSFSATNQVRASPTSD